jgi:hypothetical protein
VSRRPKGGENDGGENDGGENDGESVGQADRP